MRRTDSAHAISIVRCPLCDYSLHPSAISPRIHGSLSVLYDCMSVMREFSLISGRPCPIALPSTSSLPADAHAASTPMTEEFASLLLTLGAAPPPSLPILTVPGATPSSVPRNWPPLPAHVVFHPTTGYVQTHIHTLSSLSHSHTPTLQVPAFLPRGLSQFLFFAAMSARCLVRVPCQFPRAHLLFGCITTPSTDLVSYNYSEH